jgi:two-component system cell cycle sensor histidine kinase/response regulator CckA
MGAEGLRALAYTAPTVASCLLCLAAFVAIVFPRRAAARAVGANGLAVAMIAQLVWGAGFVGELFSSSLASKIDWDDVQVLPAFATSLGMLWFAMAYTGRAFRRPWLAWPLVGFLPAVTSLFILTSRWHGVARPHARLLPGDPFDELVYDLTPLDLLGYLYAWGVQLVAIGLLVLEMRRRPRIFRVPLAIVAFGCALPSVSIVVFFAGGTVLGQRDSTPLSFGVGAALVAWALLRHQFFDLIPIARDKIIEAVPDPIVVVDASDRVVDANLAARSILADAVVGAPLRRVLPSWEGLVAAHAEPAWHAEVAHASTDGERFYELRVAELRDPGGQRRGRAVVMHDITDRRRAAVASEQRFRAVFEQTFQFIGVLGLDGALLEANRAALDLVGARLEDVIGRPFVETAWWSHSAVEQEKLEEAIVKARGGETVRFEATHPGAGGELHHVDFSLKPAIDADGRTTLLVAEGRDVTELKSAEGQKRTLEMQLLQAQKMESLGRLAGGVAHDFNNLLTVILGNATLMRTLYPSADPQGFLDGIEHASKSAAELTRQLLAFGRRQVLERRVVDVRTIVERFRTLLGRLIGETIQIDVAVSASPATALVDPAQIEQMVVNLAINARDAMPDGGKLTIRVAVVVIDDQSASTLAIPAGPCVELSVTDTGSGMSEGLRAQIFEPFFTTKATGKGTGLGLSIVYGAVQQNEGVIAVASKVGEGTTFRILFPLVDAAADARDVADSTLPRGRERVWLVEDQPLVRSFVEKALVQLGYQVRSFASGEQALEALASLDSADLLLTDLVLPNLDGFTLSTRIQEARPGIRVVFASGHSDDVLLRHGGLPAGARFISKPFTVEDLARTVRASLDEGKAPAPESPHVLVIDDDPMICTLVATLLQTLGCTVSTLEDAGDAHGAIASAAARGASIDLVLLDLNLGGSSGLDVCRDLRARGVDVAIVCMSGDTRDRAACAEAGFDGVLDKPVGVLGLRACLQGHAGQRHVPPPAAG